MKSYIAIELTRDKSIVETYSFPPIAKRNVWDVSKDMANLWLECSTKYPHPEYDIIWGSFE